jgi:hypothetical protein
LVSRKLWGEDADRGIVAVEALLAALSRDHRVQDVYIAWRQHALEPLLKLPAGTRDRGQRGDLIVSTLAVGMFSHVDSDLEVITRLVNHDLHLEALSWLPEALLRRFRAALIAEAGGEDMHFRRPNVTMTRRPGETLASFSRRLAAETDAAPGRGRTAGRRSDHIQRDVEWYYRAEIKRPKDSLYALGREYTNASREPIGGNGKDTVLDGILRAKVILTGVSLR